MQYEKLTEFQSISPISYEWYVLPVITLHF